MHVLATAGHVDHGKSTLVRALTGTDPDRLVEEHRRGLTIELGYCWTSLPGVGDVAFVDVPGHERFVSTMLAGVGPVPAVLFVVAADDPWMPQAAEHLAALDALGVRHGVVAVTRADLADPGPAVQRARAATAGTTLQDAPVLGVSGRTGTGLEELRAALAAMLSRLPTPDPDTDVRLWVDRRFQLAGAGTVVTGTLPAGTIRRGDRLTVDEEVVRVRGLQTLTRQVDAVRGPARVALSLGGAAPPALARGSALVTPDAWLGSATADVRVSTPDASVLPERPMLHIGAASLAVHRRALGDDLARLRLPHPLPLRVGDRVLLRDPGSRRLWGATVLDPVPPPLDRRGAARARAKQLAGSDGVPSLRDELRRRRTAEAATLRRIGVAPDAELDEEPGTVRAGGWLLDAGAVPELADRLTEMVRARAAERPLDPGVPVTAAARGLDVDAALVPALVREPLLLEQGTVTLRGSSPVTPEVRDAVAGLAADLAGNPFAAPESGRLAELGLTGRTLAAAARAGLVLRLAEGVVLLPGADRAAVERLATLTQPFTVSEARRALGTTRRVVLPLLALLDRQGLTRRLPDDRRTTPIRL